MNSHHSFKSLDFSPEAIEVFEKIRNFPPQQKGKFLSQVRYLNEYGDKDIKVSLHKDWVDYSFSLVWLKKNIFWMNGGLIYNKDLKDWSIHT